MHIIGIVAAHPFVSFAKLRYIPQKPGAPSGICPNSGGGPMSLTVEAHDQVAASGKPGRHLDGAGGGGVRGLYGDSEQEGSQLAAPLQLAGASDLSASAVPTISPWRSAGACTEARKALADQVDRLLVRRAERARRRQRQQRCDFEEAAKGFFLERRVVDHCHACGPVLTTMAQFVSPIIGALPVGEIDITLVLRVLQQEVPARRRATRRAASGGPGPRPPAGSAAVEAVLDWATARGLRQGDNQRLGRPLAEVLPAPAAGRQASHHVALAYSALPTFMVALRRQEGVAARRWNSSS